MGHGRSLAQQGRESADQTACDHPAPARGVGAPGGIRTPDPQIRSLVLYPAELRAPALPRRGDYGLAERPEATQKQPTWQAGGRRSPVGRRKSPLSQADPLTNIAQLTPEGHWIS